MSDLVLFQPVRAWDRNGVFSPGAKAYFYEPGTSDPRTVYTDDALSVAHPTPVVANARGVFAPVYTSGSVDYLVRDADDVVLTAQTSAFLSSASGSAAGGTSFEPTSDIPVTNVQAAIERVQTNYEADFAALGLGITSSAPLLSSFDAENIPSGKIHRFDMAVTTGTGASDWGGAETGVFVFYRENANSGIAIAASRDDGYLWSRQLAAGTWAAWSRVTGAVQDQATWNAGTGATESLISPAKLEASFRARRLRIVVEDHKASGTNGGASTATTWVTRVLNTVVENTITGASLASNIITLPAGEYRLDEAIAPAYAVGGHQCRLWNNDGSVALVLGTSEYSGGSTVSTSRAVGRFTLTAETDVLLQHWCATTKVTDGLGVAASSGAGEVYSRVVITRLGDYVA